jgi:hypothetical protein
VQDILTSDNLAERIELEGNAEQNVISFAGTSDKVGASPKENSWLKADSTKRHYQPFQEQMNAQRTRGMSQSGPTQENFYSKRVPGLLPALVRWQSLL